MSAVAHEARGKRSAAYLAMVPLLTIVWGGNWPAVKIALGEISPWTLRAGGLFLGGTILALVGLARGETLTVRREYWWRLGIAGALSIAVFNVLLAFAQLSAATSRVAIVTFTMPVWTVLFARFLLGERLDRRRMTGLALGISGLVALGWPLIAGGQFSAGLLYALAAGVAWALGTVLTKRWPVGLSPIAVAAWQLLIGAACATVGMLVFEGIPQPHALKTITMLALAYHILMSIALGHLLWFAVIANVPAGVASLGTLMIPAVGVYGAMMLLGERPTLSDYIGLVLVVAAAATVLLPSFGRLRRAR